MQIITEIATIPPRPRQGHKGTFGRVLVVAGSRGMAGAALLCGSSALRGGAGLVQVAGPADILSVLANNACLLTAELASDTQGRLTLDAEHRLVELAQLADVVAIGPGLGQSNAIRYLLERLWVNYSGPLVVDADGLNVLAPFAAADLPTRTGATIFTPHLGEFSRLTERTIPELQTHREERALEFAGRYGVILVLKGAGTLVTDGHRLFRNTTGNPGMATAGAGDVLTGLVAAFLGQMEEPFFASILGVYLHGKAGDAAVTQVGELALTSFELLDYLPHAMHDASAS